VRFDGELVKGVVISHLVSVRALPLFLRHRLDDLAGAVR